MEDVERRLQSLAERLKITRPLCFLDLETTGTVPEVDRVIEVCWIAVHPDGRVKRFRSLVNPEMPIPPDATAIHGIRDEDVASAPAFREIAKELHARMTRWDLAGFNVRRYDLKMLAAEFARCGMRFSAEDATVIDSMSIYHRNERRDLTAAVKFYCQRDHQGHRAEADVAATIDVLLGQLDRYGELPKDVAELDDYCRNKQPDWLTVDGRVAWRDGAPRITFGKHKGKSLQELARLDPGYLRWIVDKDFSDATRKIAEDALQGTFPFPPTPPRPVPADTASGAFPAAKDV